MIKRLRKLLLSYKPNLAKDPYRDLIKEVYQNGTIGTYRNGERRSDFGKLLTYDLRERFPITTLRRIAYMSCFREMLWFISGSTKVDEINPDGRNYWDQWAINGDIGALYGKSFRHAPNNGFSKYSDELLSIGGMKASDVADEDYKPGETVDQLQDVIYGLRNRPHSSRHRIAIYIPSWVGDEKSTFEENYEKGKGTITPCASLLHFTTRTVNGKLLLSLHVVQASSDVLIGLPLNIAQYALLLMLVAREVDMTAGFLYYTINDAHLYENQIPLLESSGFLDREPMSDACEVIIDGDKDIYHVTIEDITVVDYRHHRAISFPVST